MSHLLIADNPKDLADAQLRLIEDIESKIETAKDEARTTERMKDQMIAARLSPSQARALHRRATDRVAYLVKVKEALTAGYCMMPDMPGDIIAVRTKAAVPSSAARAWRSGSAWSVPDEQAGRSLPSGEGRYVSPHQVCESKIEKVTRKNYDGTTRQDDQQYTRAVELRDPYNINRRFVRPAVMTKTHAAMALRLFDEIVCINPASTRRRSRDPIVLGRIVSGSHVAAFLIAWFVDTAEL